MTKSELYREYDILVTFFVPRYKDEKRKPTFIMMLSDSITCFKSPLLLVLYYFEVHYKSPLKANIYGPLNERFIQADMLDTIKIGAKVAYEKLFSIDIEAKEYMTKLFEDVGVLTYQVIYAKSSRDYVAAIIIFAKLRSKGSLMNSSIVSDTLNYLKTLVESEIQSDDNENVFFLFEGLFRLLRFYKITSNV
jgi:hypothetical protein